MGSLSVALAATGRSSELIRFYRQKTAVSLTCQIVKAGVSLCEASATDDPAFKKQFTSLLRDTVGSEYPLQVRGRDFALDLLFFHRGLNSLVAFELKVGRFEPEYLGKLAFYLEALDRDVRKPHECPSIGVLLCASKDNEVVEYSLSRTLSPAMIAEYQIQLPDKKLPQAKLHEFYRSIFRMPPSSLPPSLPGAGLCLYEVR
jgi:hypothetical protein